MSKLFIVCPECGAKYAVADQGLNGKTVSCKKCQTKFAAKVLMARAPAASAPAATPAKTAPTLPEEDPLGSSDPFGSADPLGNSNPLGDDLFADLPSSTQAAPALAAMPKKKASKSSGSFPVLPLVLGGVGLVVVIGLVAIVAVVASNVSSGLGDFSSGGLSVYQQHQQVVDEQFEIMVKFLETMEGLSEGNESQFIDKMNALTKEVEQLGAKARGLPSITVSDDKKLQKEVLSRLEPLKKRMLAAGMKLQKFNKNPDVVQAVLKFHQTSGKMSAKVKPD